MESRTWNNDEWSVFTEKASIVDSQAIEALEEQLKIPMPEMVFGKNRLGIVHEPSQLSIVFDPVAALDEVDKTYNGKTKILQVAHSGAWKASKIRSKHENPVTLGNVDYDVNKVHHPFDWTYTNDYKGTLTPNGARSSLNPIPYDELKRPDPILFFDEVPLYEDELGDFGLTTHTVKIRVMPNNLFVLARLYVRVDNVAFRIRDTRIYVDFRTNKITREYTEKEGAYDEVKKRVPIWAEDFTQMLRDPAWVDSVLPPLLQENCEIPLQVD